MSKNILQVLVLGAAVHLYYLVIAALSKYAFGSADPAFISVATIFVYNLILGYLFSKGFLS